MNIVELNPPQKRPCATRRRSRERRDCAAVIDIDQAKGLDSTSHIRATIDARGRLFISNNINPYHTDTLTDALLLLLSKTRRAHLDRRPVRDNCDYGPPDRV
jgi:hypothetical protein